jgi:hypothetical protein
MVWSQAKRRRQLRVSRFKCLPTKEIRCYMRKAASLSLPTVTIPALLVMDPVSVWRVIVSLSSAYSWTTNASPNAPVTISLRNTCAKDATLTAWSVLMEAPDALSAIRERIFRGIPVWSSAEWAVSSKMRLLWHVINVNHRVPHAPNRQRFVIHACKFWQRSSSIWTSVWPNARLK